ncbi:claudin-4-like [Hemibagrus wyckioides]|uniref:claudin-4-like n=1 Tax=Hemibagrus wyckioides TaxID=337641 RepID=UPI00266D4062|nr:claudin-4-like [Hemibagrus wyckioides]
MVSQNCQILGLVLALIGFVGTIIICGLPAWKMTAFIGANIVTFQYYWEGLWMDCVIQTTGQMQCKVYDSMLILPIHLQAARALIIVALVFGIIGIIATIMGGKCTNFVQDENAKARIAIASGIVFIITGILVLIPVCWTTNAVIREFYNPTIPDGQKKELGPCLYIGIYGKMVSQKCQILGLILALIGFVGTIVICGLPAWKMTAFIGANIVTFQYYWEGLWMDCVVQMTGQMQCKVYDSMLILPIHLQAARALIIVALVFGIIGIIVTVMGGKCTNFVQDENAKARIAIASGIVFIITGILVLIPVCWTTNAVIREFYNPTIPDGQKKELGPCLYIGFGSAALLIAGGALLCSSCPPNDEPSYHVKYSPAKSTMSSNKVYV